MDKPTARIKPKGPPVKVTRLNIFLKSGHEIEVVCEDWKFEYSNLTLDYTGYDFKGLSSPKRIGIAPSQIAGYIVK